MRTTDLIAIVALAATPLAAQSILPPFSANYSYVDLGAPPGVPSNYGGVAFDVNDPDALYIAGHAARATGAVYRVPVTRDASGRITGFAGNAAKIADAPNIDGGLQFGPGGVLFFTRYGQNELGQIAPGSAAMTVSVPLTPLGVLPSVGALSFIPAGHPRAGDLKLMSFNRSTVYTAALVPDGTGTYGVASVTAGPTISGGPEGFLFITPDSPHFTNFEHMIVSEWSVGEISVYHLDPVTGDPEPASRQVFMTGVPGCEGAAHDPVSGDFLFSMYGAARVLAVRGFGTPCGRILHYGRETVGSAGIAPVLTSRGCFARRQVVSLEITDGLGGAPGVLMTGLQAQSAPVLGIEVLVVPLVVGPHVLSGAAGTPGAGAYSAPMSIPDATNLLGTEFFFQAAYLDAGGPLGLSATDGMQLNVR